MIHIPLTLTLRCNYYGNYGVAKGFDPQSAANVLKGTDTLHLIRGKHFTSKKPLKLTDSTVNEEKPIKHRLCPPPAYLLTI